MEAWMRAIRLAARRLRRSPGTSLMSVAILAVGAGASTAIFGLANWALFRPLPGVTDAGELVSINLGLAEREGISRFSHPTALRLLEPVPALSSAAAYTPMTVDLLLGTDSPARRARVHVVTPGYFETLGVRGVRGRTFRPEEGAGTSVYPVAVVSEAFWREWLEAESDVLGRQIEMNRESFTVVGVAPSGFAGPRRGDEVDVWLPSSALPAIEARLPSDVLTMEGAPVWLGIVGRLSPGASAGDVAPLLARVAPELEPAGLEVRVDEDIALSGATRERFHDLLGTLGGLVSLLLLLTAASLANLVLSRVARRRGEVGVRRALGAPRGRLAVELVAEGGILAAVGSAAAVLTALGVLRILGGTRVLSWLPEAPAVPLDWRVLSFALGASLLAVAGATAAGVLRTGRGHPLAALRETDRVTRSKWLTRRALLGLQVALSLALVIGAGLMLRSMESFRATDLGFDPEGVLVFSLSPGVQGYGDADADRLFRSLVQDLETLPQIRTAGFTWLPPLGPQRYSESVRPVGDARTEPIAADANMVSPAALGALGIRMVEGRGFDDREYTRFERPDRGAVLINETLADLLFPGTAAVGQALVMEGRRESAFEVIGVVEDARLSSVREPDGPRLYDPFGNGYRTTRASFLLRFEGDGALALAAVRERVAERDPRLPLIDAELLSDRVREGVREERVLVRLTTLMALISLILAAAGLYGLASEAAQTRRREFGVRTTFGARSVQIAGLVLRDSLRTVAVGTAVGILLGAWTTRLLETRLIGVEPLDPIVFAAAPLVLGLVTVAAVLGPALRSARLDPVEVLRSE